MKESISVFARPLLLATMAIMFGLVPRQASAEQGCYVGDCYIETYGCGTSCPECGYTCWWCNNGDYGCTP
jgi:hypothetical protein